MGSDIDLAVSYAVVAFAGTKFLAENEGEAELIFALLGAEVLGGWDWILLLSVATAALASTRTTIIPRRGLSMARRAALPKRLARIHPRFRTPDVSTWTVAGIAIGWYVLIYLISENVLFDSLTALALLIAFYYSLTGLACGCTTASSCCAARPT